MNLTGSRQYSQATSAMRGGSHSTDIQFKLIFIYPMLFDTKVSKEKQLIRDFLSATFLREIFTSNFLNLVKMTNQISSFEDENGKKTDLANTLGKALMGQGGSGFGGRGFNLSQDKINKDELQLKINEDFKIIKQYLKNDPIMKKLDPKVQMITLENLISVPVVVGTVQQDLPSTSALSFLLMLAVATNTSLDKYQNIQKLTNLIKNTRKEKLWELLKKQPNKTIADKIADVLEHHPKVGKLIPKIISNRYFPKRDNIDKLEVSEIKFDNEKYSFAILDSVQTEIDEVDLFFKFFLDQTMLNNRYGLKFDKNLSGTIKKLSPEADKIFSKLHDNFLSGLSQPATKILRSVSNLILPLNDSTLKFNEVYENHIADELNTNISEFIRNSLAPSITNRLASFNIRETANIKMVKGLCKNIKGEIKIISNFIDKINEIEIRFSVKNGNQEVSEQISNFIVTLDTISTEVQALNRKTYLKLVKISDSFTVVKEEFENIIKEAVTNFIREYERNSNNDEAILSVVGLNNFPITELKEHSVIWLTNILEYLFLTALSTAICSYIKILDIEIETVKNEITDFPNYTLVLPVELILALHASYNARNLNELFTKSIPDQHKQNYNLSDGYVKGMVKYISNKLKVPNLVVIDQKKNDVYYKFMNMTSINKTKLNTIDTFNKLNLKSQESGRIQY